MTRTPVPFLTLPPLDRTTTLSTAITDVAATATDGCGVSSGRPTRSAAARRVLRGGLAGAVLGLALSVSAWADGPVLDPDALALASLASSDRDGDGASVAPVGGSMSIGPALGRQLLGSEPQAALAAAAAAVTTSEAEAEAGDRDAAAFKSEIVLLDAVTLGGDAAMLDRAVAVAPLIDAAARQYALDPLLLHAIAFVESRYRPDARSSAGALGLMQVMPATGRRFGVERRADLREAATSVDVSAYYLKWLHERFDRNLELVVAAYNAGEGAVEKYGRRVPPYGQTQRYVRSVLEQYGHLRAAAASLTTRLRHTDLAP